MMKEPFLEPILRWLRIRKILPIVRQYPGCRLLDIGCGWNYSLLKTVSPIIKCGIGIDFKVHEYENDNIKTMKMVLKNCLPFEEASFDVVIMMAVLEHLEDPLSMMKETERILKRDGRLVLTAPSIMAKPVLNFLAYRLGIISVTEINDHKRYYNYSELMKLFSQTSMTIEYHRYFQLGMNNFCVASKR